MTDPYYLSPTWRRLRAAALRRDDGMLYSAWLLAAGNPRRPHHRPSGRRPDDLENQVGHVDCYALRRSEFGRPDTEAGPNHLHAVVAGYD